jgi:hypothetical protein
MRLVVWQTAWGRVSETFCDFSGCIRDSRQRPEIEAPGHPGFLKKTQIKIIYFSWRNIDLKIAKNMEFAVILWTSHQFHYFWGSTLKSTTFGALGAFPPPPPQTIVIPYVLMVLGDHFPPKTQKGCTFWDFPNFSLISWKKEKEEGRYRCFTSLSPLRARTHSKRIQTRSVLKSSIWDRTPRMALFLVH